MSQRTGQHTETELSSIEEDLRNKFANDLEDLIIRSIRIMYSVDIPFNQIAAIMCSTLVTFYLSLWRVSGGRPEDAVELMNRAANRNLKGHPNARATLEKQ